MSLTALSESAHYSKGYLSKVENGHVQPNEALARACDKVLGADGMLVALVPQRPKPKARWTLATRPIDLPSPTRLFVGRTNEMTAILNLLSQDRSPVTRMVIICGMPGIGKTELAVQAAGRLLDRYPDGCLFLDLHGQGDPIEAPDAMDRILRRLGVPGHVIPQEQDERSAFYRQVMRDRRLLLLLDNPSSAAHVSALIAPGGACDLMVASRRRLDALDEAHHLPLGALSRSEARTLFEQIANERIDASRDSDAIDRITDLCARLPLAVRIIAARFSGATVMPIMQLVSQLADERRRITALDDGERSLVETFAAACSALPPAQARLFALLSTHPGATFDTRVAGLVADIESESAAQLLDGLAGASLVLRLAPDRYAFHDLVRSVAALRARTVLPAEESDAARDRLACGYLHAAQHADITATPERHRELPVRPGPADWYADFDGAAAASRWFDLEQDNLVHICELAAAIGRHDACWKLAYAMRDHFFRTTSWRPWIRTHQLALASARHCHDQWAVAVTLNNLGLAYAITDRCDLADQHYAEALDIFRDLDDRYGEANTIGHQAWTAYCRRDYRTAIDKGTAALAFYREAGVLRNAAITLRTIGLAEAAIDLVDAAVEHLQEALKIFVEVGLVLDEAMALNCLGDVVAPAHNRQESVDFYRRALYRARVGGSTHEQARALRGLADAASVAGQTSAALRLAAQAAALAGGSPAAPLTR